MPLFKKTSLGKTIRNIQLSTVAEFFFFNIMHRCIHFPFNLCIKDTDFDTLSKQGHTDRYVLPTDQFLKIVLGL